jgi:acyl-coenzyme A synthetase/AMP-(fatty) acid ligase/uncharacterized protein YbaR (Trm112 family)
MLNQTFDTVACPACRIPLRNCADNIQGERILRGALECPQCAISVPVVHGFALFTEALPGGTGELPQKLEQLELQLSASADYFSFIHHRHTRRIPDRYAAFQPFNESTRAFYALADLIRTHLKPGDKILDTWGRSGWSGEMLAAAFPEQHVISIWEGNHDVLGYAGYAHWLPHARRAPNHDIVFAAAGAGLPFLDRQFSLVHGLDSLHRYAPLTFGGDILRIARDDGIIVFPHVHLSNSQPQPFFERGGWQAHGTAYQDRFERALGRRQRSVMVMSEITLFNANGPLRSEPDTPHYNGVVALVPPEWAGAPLRRADLDIRVPESGAVLNPLLRIDALAGSAAPDIEALGGLMEELMLRHPCYAARLDALGEQPLSPAQLQVLFQLAQLRTLAETAQRLSMPIETVSHLAATLATQELLQLAPLSGAMSQLQSYYADQVVRPLPAEETFAYLWQLLPSLYGERPILVSGADGSVFGWAEVELLVTTLQRGLHALGVGAGDRVVMLCGTHPEALLLCWAIWRNGSVVVPLRKELAESGAGLASLLDHIAPALLVLDGPRAACAALATCQALLLDDPDEQGPAALPALSTLLDGWFDLPPDQHLARPALPGDAAVIIFTSGSTGRPKGVVLSQRALLQSGQLATTSFGWHDKDILLSLSELHTMSGLRNPAVAALFAGATVYVPQEAERANVGKTLQAAAVHGVTVLATGPAWLSMLDSLPAHLTLHPGALRQILSTGAALPSALHARLAARMRLDIVDYYGLTETGGLCLLFDHAGETAARGRPVGALMQVCDAGGAPVGPGIAGEVRVHSNQLMSGYWRDPAQSSAMLRDGWLYTGDIASHDGRGSIELLGRRDDQLKNEYGDIVHPAHLERLMMRHPLVRDAAVGASARGLVALLVTLPGFALPELAAFCRQRMPEHPFPRDIRELPALPHTAAGKLDRAQVARWIHENEKSS